MFGEIESSEPLQRAISQLFGDQGINRQPPNHRLHHPLPCRLTGREKEKQKLERLKKTRKIQKAVWNSATKQYQFMLSSRDIIHRNIQEAKAKKLREAQLKAASVNRSHSTADPPPQNPTSHVTPREKPVQRPAPQGTKSAQNDSETRSVTIKFYGKSYELVGVPQARKGRPLRIACDRIESNLIYYYYPGHSTTYESAVILPQPKGPKPVDHSLVVRKPAIRLTSDVNSGDHKHDLSTVDFLRTVQSVD